MKRLVLFVLCFLFCVFNACSENFSKDDIKEAPNASFVKSTDATIDYLNTNNWGYVENNPKKNVDVFFIYPTLDGTIIGNEKISIIDDNLKKQVKRIIDVEVSAFAPYTNVFVPYYRQVSFPALLEFNSGKEYENFVNSSVAKEDIFSALDVYFKKYNNERPFILAGHSQGSVLIKAILSDYMKRHPKYLKRMVASYPIGVAITKEWLKENPHLKFAENETDTGVIISWNVEGPNAKNNRMIFDHTLAINPINWKRDETPASVNENKGKFNPDLKKIEKADADATIDLKRGVVVCKTTKDFVPKEVIWFGNESFHYFEYFMYYANLQENVKKRIDVFLEK